MRKSFYLYAFLAAIPLALGAGCSSKPGDKDKASEQETKPDAPQPAAVEEPANPAKFPDVVAKVNATDIEKAELLEQVSSVENQARGAIDTTTHHLLSSRPR